MFKYVSYTDDVGCDARFLAVSVFQEACRSIFVKMIHLYIRGKEIAERTSEDKLMADIKSVLKTPLPVGNGFV